MNQNQEKIKQTYTDFRIKMKSLPTGEKRSQVKKEMSNFLEATANIFGQDIVNNITKKKS